ncbi:hypothetical protein Sjap_025421 [Stephania japonica]|uniref:Apple domain-containing protein n=1 Tax=Stephania japonica TaxID=461633 RepID=A0AAP0E496_9MAGN
MESVKVPDTSNARVDKSLGIKECEIECRKNFSCTGYTAVDINGEGSGCIAWFGELADIKEYTEGGQAFFVRVDELRERKREEAERHKKGRAKEKEGSLDLS